MDIKKLVDEAKRGEITDDNPNIIQTQPKQAQKSYTVPNPNSIKVTFRIYLNPTCDESDYPNI